MTILNNHINYTRRVTYTNIKGDVVTDNVQLPNQVVTDKTGAPHNLHNLMDLARINYKNRFIKMATEM